jgi:hypothetical protein
MKAKKSTLNKSPKTTSIWQKDLHIFGMIIFLAVAAIMIFYVNRTLSSVESTTTQSACAGGGINVVVPLRVPDNLKGCLSNDPQYVLDLKELKKQINDNPEMIENPFRIGMCGNQNKASMSLLNKYLTKSNPCQKCYDVIVPSSRTANGKCYLTTPKIQEICEPKIPNCNPGSVKRVFDRDSF